MKAVVLEAAQGTLKTTHRFFLLVFDEETGKRHEELEGTFAEYRDAHEASVKITGEAPVKLLKEEF